MPTNGLNWLWAGLVALVVAPTVTASPLDRRPVDWPAPSPVERLAVSAAANSGDAAMAVDDDPRTCWQPVGAGTAWLAMQLKQPAAGPLMAVWQATGFRYDNVEQAPIDYHWDASADSTNGSDGHWHPVAQVTGNKVRTAADVLDAAGAQWIRLVVERAGPKGLALPEVMLGDTHAAAHPDAWFMLGDSITDGAFNAIPTHDLRETVHAALPTLNPVVIDGGTPSDNTKEGLERWALALDRCPRGCFVGIAFGTNDCASGLPPDTYRTNLQRIIDAVVRSGRTPMLARMPWFPHPRFQEYLAVVDLLTEANGLPPGPDLYRWFRHHRDEFGKDGIHPNAEGRRSVQRLWGQAIVKAYQSRIK